MSVFYSAARSPGLPAEQLAGCPGDAQLGKGVSQGQSKSCFLKAAAMVALAGAFCMAVCGSWPLALLYYIIHVALLVSQ